MEYNVIIIICKEIKAMPKRNAMHYNDDENKQNTMQYNAKECNKMHVTHCSPR